MKSNTRREEVVVDHTEEFRLRFPKEIDIKPDFLVAVTPTRTARIYKETRPDTEHRNGKYVTVKCSGYRVIYVINRTGQQPKSDVDRYGRGGNGHWYRSPLDLQLALAEYSALNLPSKKNVTTNTQTVYAPDE